MKKLNRACGVTNMILAILYLPLSLFSFLMYMASEATIGANNPLFICLIHIFCFITFILPFLCFGCLFESILLRKNGHSIASFVVQFIPLVIFIMNILLLTFAETLPPTI